MAIRTGIENVDTSELRRHCEARFQMLDDARRPWFEFVTAVATEMLPSRLPYLLDPAGQQRGGEQNTHMVDAVAHLSIETSAAGVTSAAMPATSPWFDLAVRNEFRQDDEIRLFLEEGRARLLAMHSQSNAAQTLPEPMKEWVAFGTGAAMVVEDDEFDYFLEPLSAGEYWIAEDRRGKVDTLYRHVGLTVRQLADEFGVDRLSPTTAHMYELKQFDHVVPCRNAIEPDHDGANPDPDRVDRPWRSVWYELGADCRQVLAIRYYDRFPVLVWRWSRLPGCAYGYGRGMDALPSMVRLRKMIYRYGQAMAHKADPAVQVPPGLQAHEVKSLPGGVTSVFGQQPIQNLRKIDLELSELAEEIDRTRQEVRDILGATLVASLRSIRHQMTAREADIRTTQDLQEFLPSLNRLNDELLRPYVEWLWHIAARNGHLPDQPHALNGQVVDIEMTSPLARRARQQEVDGIVRTYAIAGEIAKIRPDVVDELNPGESVRIVAQIEGAPVATMLPREAVREIRTARAQQEAAQRQADAAEQSAGIAKTAAEAGAR